MMDTLSELDRLLRQLVHSKTMTESLLRSSREKFAVACLASTERAISQEELDDLSMYLTLEGRLLAINALIGLVG